MSEELEYPTSFHLRPGLYLDDIAPAEPGDLARRDGAVVIGRSSWEPLDGR